MKHLGSLLIVEDDPRDMKRAAEAAKLAGFSALEGKTTPGSARNYLEERLSDERGLPDGIVLDLDLGHESGYELLRFWHSSPQLRAIPLIVWSVLGEEQRNMCSLFKVEQFVGKWEGSEALAEALKRIGEA